MACRSEWSTPTGRGSSGSASSGIPTRVLAQIVDLSLGDKTAATDVARTGQPVIIRNAAEYAERYPGPRVAAVVAEEASWLIWPLTVGKATVGSIVLMWKRPQRFQPGQLAFITAVADLVAHALVRARIYADEHAIATVLQRAVMPKMTAPIPGLDVGSCYRQAGTSWVIGGDWYDALALPGGRAYITVGDVAGHGISAAEDMTQIRNAGRALADRGLPAGQAAGRAEPAHRIGDQGPVRDHDRRAGRGRGRTNHLRVGRASAVADQAGANGRGREAAGGGRTAARAVRRRRLHPAADTVPARRHHAAVYRRASRAPRRRHPGRHRPGRGASARLARWPAARRPLR